MTNNGDYTIVNTDTLIPLEKVFPEHLKNLTRMILKDKIMAAAIIADQKTRIVLDGSHRYAFLLQQGYQKAPVIYVDYDD